MEKVTGQQCRDLIAETKARSCMHHRCSICGVWVSYYFDGDNVYFDPSCGCCVSHSELRSWANFAENFNRQTPRVRAEAWENLKNGEPIFK